MTKAEEDVPTRFLVSSFVAFVVVSVLCLALAWLLSERPLEAPSVSRNSPRSELRFGDVILIGFDSGQSQRWAYFLDPPSPPYCTPFYTAPDCFRFGGFRPSEQDSTTTQGSTEPPPVTFEEFDAEPREVGSEQITVASGESYQLHFTTYSQTKVGDIVVFEENTMASVDYQLDAPDFGHSQRSRMKAIFDAARPFLDHRPVPSLAITAWRGDQPIESCYFDLLNGEWFRQCVDPEESE